MKNLALIFLLAFSSLSYGNDSLLEEIISLFHYDRDSISVIDLKERFREELGGDKIPLQAYRIKSNESEFHSAQVSVGEIGTAMSPLFLESYDKPENKKLLNNGAFFITTGTLGAGGSNEILYVQFPSRNLEMAVSFAINHDPLIEKNSKNESHLSIFREGYPEKLNQKMLNLVNLFNQEKGLDFYTIKKDNFKSNGETENSQIGKNTTHKTEIKEKSAFTHKKNTFFFIILIAGILFLGVCILTYRKFLSR